MNRDQVQRILAERFHAQPMPAGQVSSYWQLYAGSLDCAGFEKPYARSIGQRAIAAVERLSYRRVTLNLPGFQRTWAAALDAFGELRRRDPAATAGAGPNFNVFKSACVASVLLDHWNRHALRPATIAIIGDGYGMLGALLSRMAPQAQLYAIDLPAGLVAQSLAYAAACAERTSWSSDPARPARFTFVPADQIDAVAAPIDCAVNVASMQEMDLATIGLYFRFLRQRTTAVSHFYCVNRVEKTLPDGTVIRFDRFPWQDNDMVLMDGLCPYYTHYVAARPPFIRPFDGPHWHRLATLAPLAEGGRA
jgi:hypothetical protein